MVFDFYFDGVTVKTGNTLVKLGPAGARPLSVLVSYFLGKTVIAWHCCPKLCANNSVSERGGVPVPLSPFFNSDPETYLPVPASSSCQAVVQIPSAFPASRPTVAMF